MNLQTQDGWTEAIPKVCCLLEVELQQLSFVQRKKKEKKLLKITNYPSLAAYRTIPEPQRMPAVLTLTETTHVTQSKSSSFFFSSLPSFFFSLSLFRLIWSVSLCLSAFTSVSPLLCLRVDSKANKCCAAIGSNRWESVSLEKTVIQLYNNMIRLLRCDSES